MDAFNVGAIKNFHAPRHSSVWQASAKPNALMFVDKILNANRLITKRNKVNANYLHWPEVPGPGTLAAAAGNVISGINRMVGNARAGITVGAIIGLHLHLRLRLQGFMKKF